MIQDLKKFSSGRADLSSKFSRAGPGRLDLKILLGRADSVSKFSRAGPTWAENSSGQGKISNTGEAHLVREPGFTHYIIIFST